MQKKFVGMFLLMACLSMLVYGQNAASLPVATPLSTKAAPAFEPIPEDKFADAAKLVNERIEGQRPIPPVQEAYWVYLSGIVPLKYKKQGTMILDDWDTSDTEPSAILLINTAPDGTKTWTLGIVDVLWEKAVKSKHSELPMPFTGGLQIIYKPPQGFFKHWKKENWADASMAEAPTGNTVEKRYLSYNPFRERYYEVFANDPRFKDFLSLYEEVLKQRYNVKLKK